MQTIDPSGVCLFYNLSPFFSAILSYLFFKERMTTRKWAGLGISIVGIFYFTAPSFFLNPTSLLTSPSFAHILMLISVATASLGWILVRILVKNRGFSPLFVNGISMLIGGAFALPLSNVLEGRTDLLNIENPGSFMLLLGALIFLANVVFYNLYSYLLKKYTATVLSFFGLLTPLFVAVLQYFFLDIPISSGFFASICIISFGIYIFYQEELQQGYIT
jgi:drug/metabolite transporter (DMT)-like permease